LPPPGPFSFVFDWAAEGIGLSRHEVDASVVREAAEHAKTLWENGGPTDRGGRTSYGLG
jgi:hypothetical protein